MSLLEKLYPNHLTVRELAQRLAALPEDQQDLIFAYDDDGRKFGVPKDKPMLKPMKVNQIGYESCYDDEESVIVLHLTEHC